MRPELRLQRLLSDEYAGSWNALLGELQLSFLLLLYVSSLAALDQWKSMVALLCASIPACDASTRARVLSGSCAYQLVPARLRASREGGRDCGDLGG